MLSYLEKSFEADVVPAWDKSSNENNFWLTLVTITTVGYGDGYPATHLGRFIMTIACIFGMFMFSLIIKFFNDNFTSVSTSHENGVYSLCKENNSSITESKVAVKIRQSLDVSPATRLKQKRSSVFASPVTKKKYILHHRNFFNSWIQSVNKAQADLDEECEKLPSLENLTQRFEKIQANVYGNNSEDCGKDEFSMQVKLQKLNDIVVDIANKRKRQRDRSKMN
jgi:hypothetical protein